MTFNPEHCCIMKIVLFQCILSESTFEWNRHVYKQLRKPRYTAWFDTEPNWNHRALKVIRWSLRLGWMGHYRTIRGFPSHFSSCLKSRRSRVINTVFEFLTIFLVELFVAKGVHYFLSWIAHFSGAVLSCTRFMFEPSSFIDRWCSIITLPNI